MDMQKNSKGRNISTQARVSFSQSETSSLLRVGELNFSLLLVRGVNRKDPKLGQFSDDLPTLGMTAVIFEYWISEEESFLLILPHWFNSPPQHNGYAK